MASSAPSTDVAAAEVTVLVGLAGAKAREENNKGAEEEEDHGDEGGPHADGVVGVGAGVAGVDMVFNDLVGFVKVGFAEEG